MIDILVPVLGRPQNAAPLVENIRDVSTVPVNIVFLCSDGDDKQISACEATGCRTIIGADTGPGDYAKKTNYGLRATGPMPEFADSGEMIYEGDSNDWIFQGADDLTFHLGWDTAALQAAGDRYDVIATNDMSNGSVRRGLFGTHNLIRRRHVTDGHVLYEGYDHNFVDRELCGRAQQAGVYAFARSSRVKHNHPLWRTAKSDPTYVKSLARFREDQALFLSRAHLWDYCGLSAHERKMAA